MANAHLFRRFGLLAVWPTFGIGHVLELYVTGTML
jgi:hypothetical protein